MTDGVELLVGDPIEAWRVWTVAPHRRSGELLLHGIYYATPWIPRRPMRAHCIDRWSKHPDPAAQPHSAPAPNKDGCGIYAARAPELIMSWLPMVTDRTAVVGRVALWGRICRHEDGYRSEFGYPLDLTVLPSPDGLDSEFVARVLADAYGVEAMAAPLI